MLVYVVAGIGLIAYVLRKRFGGGGDVYAPTLGSGMTGAQESTERDANIEHLEPTFAKAVQALIADLQTQGLDPVLYEGYRSGARQAMLHAAGRSKVDWSYHMFQDNGKPAALAADIISASKGWASSTFFDALALAAERRGMESGHRWRWTDSAHVQAAPSSVLNAVAKGHVNPLDYVASLVLT